MLVYFVSLVDKIVGGVALSGNHNYYVVALTVRLVLIGFHVHNSFGVGYR